MADTNKLFNLDRTSAIFEYSRQMFSPIMVKGQEAPLDIFDLGSKVLLEDGGMLNFSAMLPSLNNALINFVFSISKMLFTIFSAIYIGLTNGIKSIDTVISNFIDASSLLFQAFRPTVLPIAVGVLLFYAFYMFLKFHKPFLRTFFLGLLGIALLNVIYAPNYTYSVRGQTKVNKSGVAMIYDKTSAFLEEISDKASEGLISNKSKVQLVDEKNPEARDLDSQSQSAVLIYFEKTLWETYKGMNADRKSDGTYNLTDQQLIALIAYQNDNNGDFEVVDGSESKKALKEVAGKADKPTVKQLRGGWINKWTYALVSVFETILSGVILDTIAVMSAALRLGVLFLFVFLPLILLLAALPFFTNLIPNFFKLYMSYLATSQFLNLFGVMLLVLDMTVYNLFMKFFNNYIIVAFFARLMTYAILYGFRHHWLHLFSPNKYRATNTMLNKMTSMADKPLQNTLDFAKDKMSTVALATFGASRLASRQLKEKQEADAKIKSMETNYNKYKKQGYSDEVAFLKAQQDEENKALQKAKASRPREVYNRSKAFLNRMAAAGYINPEHPNIQRHIEKAETAEQRADALAEERETLAASSADLGSKIEKREKAEEVFSHYDVSGLKKDGYKSNLSYKLSKSSSKSKPFKESPRLHLEAEKLGLVQNAKAVIDDYFVMPQTFFIDFISKIKTGGDPSTAMPTSETLKQTHLFDVETSMNYTSTSPTAMPTATAPVNLKQTQNVDMETSANFTSTIPTAMPTATAPVNFEQIQNVDMETSTNYTSTSPTAVPIQPAPVNLKQTQNVDMETSANFTSTIPTAMPTASAPVNLKQTQNVDIETSMNFTSASPTAAPTESAPVNLKQTQNVDMETSTNFTSTTPTAVPTAPAPGRVKQTQSVDMETSTNFVSASPTAIPTAPAPGRVKQTQNVDMETSMNYTSTSPTAIPTASAPVNLKQTRNVDVETSTNYTSTSPTAIPTASAPVNLKQTRNVDVETSMNYTSTSASSDSTGISGAVQSDLDFATSLEKKRERKSKKSKTNKGKKGKK